MHPRNRHAGGYDFPRLVAAAPALGRFLRPAPHGGLSLDFADPDAVKALNGALLAEAYGIQDWDLPPDRLVPPVPGRADYVHHLADLLALDRGGFPPTGPAVTVLDIGTGASLIYPVIGYGDYRWSFIATEVDPPALDSARRLLAANPDLAAAVDLRRQTEAGAIFRGVLKAGERVDATLCNPPFHASAREAREAAQAKWRKLGLRAGAARNFGGQGPELWCAGGELGFIRRMIEESGRVAGQVGWFTTLVAKSAHLPQLKELLRRAGVRDLRVVAMAQGQKQSRFLAWRF